MRAAGPSQTPLAEGQNNEREDSEKSPARKKPHLDYLEESISREVPTVLSMAETSELERYRREQSLPLGSDIAKFWTERQAAYPVLFQLARIYLSIPATSVPAERVFSTAGNTITKKRNRLSPSTAELIIFLHENKAFLEGESTLLEVYEVGYKLHEKEKDEEKEKEKEKETEERESYDAEDDIEMTRALDESLARIAAIRRAQHSETVVLASGTVPQRLFN
jgi:hypothetical protein